MLVYGSFRGPFVGRSSISLEQPPGHTPKMEWHCDVESVIRVIFQEIAEGS